MKQKLGSPPDNYRFYKYTQNSNENQKQSDIHLDLDSSKKQLFKPRLVHAQPQKVSLPNNKSLNMMHKTKQNSNTTSSSKINNRILQQKSLFDLNINCKKYLKKDKSKSNIIHKQNQKIQNKNLQSNSTNNKNHVSLQQFKQSLFKPQKNQSYQLKSIQNQQDNLSNIMIKQINNTDVLKRSKPTVDCAQFYYQMVVTLRQMKQMKKQSLQLQRKMVKLLQQKKQKNHLSYLNDKQYKSDIKTQKNKYKQRKSFKRTNEKSTTKKLAGSQLLQDRVFKIEQKLKTIQQISKLYQQTCMRKSNKQNRSKKKSMSNLR